MYVNDGWSGVFGNEYEYKVCSITSSFTEHSKYFRYSTMNNKKLVVCDNPKISFYLMYVNTSNFATTVPK